MEINDITINTETGEDFRFRAIIDAMEDPVVICSAGFTIRYVNPVLEKVLGQYSGEEICYKFVFGFDAPCSWCPAENNAEEDHDRMEFLYPKNNRYYRLSRKIIFQSGCTFSQAMLMKDITEEKEMEQNLVLTRQNAERAKRAKDSFFSRISHEIRNPIHAILSLAKLGFKRSGTGFQDHKIFSYFSDIRSAAEKLLILVNDLLDKSKMESGKFLFDFRRNDINDTVNEVVSELKPLMNDYNVNVILSNEISNPYLICDAVRIRQVFRNILLNAIVYSPPDGEIRIILKETAAVTGRRSDDTLPVPSLQVTIEDQGPGIPENETDLIFEPFVQSSQQHRKGGLDSSGLGLTISREIINAHYGKIWAENRQEGGACFGFVIPYQISIPFSPPESAEDR